MDDETTQKVRSSLIRCFACIAAALFQGERQSCLGLVPHGYVLSGLPLRPLVRIEYRSPSSQGTISGA